MTSLQLVVGNANAPQDGESEFSSEVLRNAVLHFVIVDNNLMNGLFPQPDYLFDSINGKVTRGNENKFKLGEKCIFVYSKCNC